MMAIAYAMVAGLVFGRMIRRAVRDRRTGERGRREEAYQHFCRTRSGKAPCGTDTSTNTTQCGCDNR